MIFNDERRNKVLKHTQTLDTLDQLIPKSILIWQNGQTLSVATYRFGSEEHEINRPYTLNLVPCLYQRSAFQCRNTQLSTIPTLITNCYRVYIKPLQPDPCYHSFRTAKYGCVVLTWPMSEDVWVTLQPSCRVHVHQPVPWKFTLLTNQILYLGPGTAVGPETMGATTGMSCVTMAIGCHDTHPGKSVHWMHIECISLTSCIKLVSMIFTGDKDLTQSHIWPIKPC